MNDKPIRPEWKDYYNTLEEIRDSGICNMWGACPYLQRAHRELSDDQATEILLNWMHNYIELAKLYDWVQLEETIMKIYVIRAAEADNAGYISTYVAYTNKDKAIAIAKDLFIERLKDCDYTEKDISEILEDKRWVITGGNDDSLVVTFTDAEEDEFFFQVIEIELED